MKLEFCGQFVEKYTCVKFRGNILSGSRVVPCRQTEGLARQTEGLARQTEGLARHDEANRFVYLTLKTPN